MRIVGHGPPVLLVNGLGAHMAMWRVLERALNAFRLIEFDAPGTGRSATSVAPLGVRRLARVAAGVLDAVGVERVDVIGYSMGGIVAQQLALDAPGRLRRIVLVASGCGVGSVPSNLTAMLNIVTPLRFVSTRFYNRTIGGMVGGRARDDAAWVAEHGAVRMLHPPSMLGYFGQLISLTGWSSLPTLARIAHPVLVVGGDDDPLSPPANALILAHRLPQARALVIAGEGHLMLMDSDSSAHEPIGRFLAAASLDDEPAWRDARVVVDADVRAALPAATDQVQPLGAIAALARRRWR
jgi:pimeloyl-ACP methyl ester carboxylesterase